jgi:preprotein translocase subunit SecG
MRKWWNWQTHHLEGVAPKGVGVQIPPSAPCALVGRLCPPSRQQHPFQKTAIGGLGKRKLMLYGLVIAIHIIVCFFIIIVVLLQSGKSGDISAAFGGQGSQTAFGPRGAASALSKATTWSAIAFMLTSIALSVMATQRGGPKSVLQGLKGQPVKTQPAPAQTPASPPTQQK